MTRFTPAMTLFITLMATALARPAAGDRIERRGSDAALEGDISDIGPNGVTIKSSTGGVQTVTWDRVRQVITNDPSLQNRVKEYADVSLTLWRARSRVERGDYALAEPLLDRLFADYRANHRGESYETALIVAEGLLRCRLIRGANDASVIPALECARLRRKGVSTTAYAILPKLFDDSTNLCMTLPPAWLPTSDLTRLAEDLSAFDSAGDAGVAAMASLYRAAALRGVNQTADKVSAAQVDQPGVDLLRLLVNCSDVDSDRRAAGRAALETRVAELPEWARAWARYALGDSLLRESGMGQQERGLVDFAHVPASHLRQQPYLAALALARISAALVRMGDATGAATIRIELEQLVPNQSASHWIDAIARQQRIADQSASSQPTQGTGSSS